MMRTCCGEKTETLLKATAEERVFIYFRTSRAPTVEVTYREAS